MSECKWCGCNFHPTQTGDVRGHFDYTGCFSALNARIRQSDAQLAAAQEREQGLDRELRHTWWLNHGHFGALYGDDGEMQCSICPADYKRDRLEDLRVKTTAAAVARWEQALAATATVPVAVKEKQ